ncbi:unnamed protein product [Clonostachys rosea]|uniref:Uncharacterized protein n=1 Tax=Bionectria ochroleuca TaxID=29856 RepID=A0ABY6US40_BIOOC|nr:unnamed protein product [Clonostachys rosea]
MSTVIQTLAGKVALVSGSSTGIGAAIAAELASRGASVVICYAYKSERAAANAVLHGLPSCQRSIAVEADLATADGPSKLVSEVAAKYPHIDILVNNAGYSGICDITTASNEETLRCWERTVLLNGRGTMLLTRAVLPLLSPTQSRIINIGSSTSRDPDPSMTIYAGSKGMIESFTRCWARDFPPKYGCTVNTVAPGPVETESIRAAPIELLSELAARSSQTPVAPRFAKPSEIAWVVASLCEENAGWLNGLYIPVAGGRLLS